MSACCSPPFDLSQLPPPPPGRTGWPWDNPEPGLHTRLPAGTLPRISVVTPSFNQGQFLEETIRSVLLQGYPNLEYIIIDGGSTDHSVEIIRKYAPWLTHWESERDRGQSHAINKGWARVTGDLVSYINSDDIYLEGALRTVAEVWSSQPDVAVIVGAILITDEQSQLRGNPVVPRLPSAGPLDLTTLDHDLWFLPQASGFWLLKTLERLGRSVREDLHYSMDRDLYYRSCALGPVKLLPTPLATYRQHSASKTVSQVMKSFRESSAVLRGYEVGDISTLRARRKVARWRLAQGHFCCAKLYPKRSEKVWHLLVAAFYRAAYLRRLEYWGLLAHALNVERPTRWVWRKLVTDPTQGTQPC